MASLYKEAGKTISHAIKQTADATTIYRQRRSPDKSETLLAFKAIESIDINEFDQLPGKVKEKTGEILHYCINNKNWDFLYLNQALLDWMTHWMEFVGYVDTLWVDVIDWNNSLIEKEAVPDLIHLDDFIGYKDLIEIDEDIHYAIRGMFQEKKQKEKEKRKNKSVITEKVIA